MCDKEKASGKQAGRILGVHPRTLYNWEKQGTITAIRTPGGKRLYNVKEFIDNNEEYKHKLAYENENNKHKICYCRVSSNEQKEYLNRQIEYMKGKYPDHEIIEDIGGGLNFKRPGLNKIITFAMAKNVEEVIIVSKDRLARVGYELIEDIIAYSEGKIIVDSEKELGQEEELAEDMLQVINTIVAQMNDTKRHKLSNKNE